MSIRTDLTVKAKIKIPFFPNIYVIEIYQFYRV